MSAVALRAAILTRLQAALAEVNSLVQQLAAMEAANDSTPTPIVVTDLDKARAHQLQRKLRGLKT